MVFPLNKKENVVSSQAKKRSQGYLKDLAYINMAGSFFTNARDDILKENPFITPVKNNDIDLLLKVKNECDSFSTFITDLISSPVHYKSDALKFEKYCDKIKEEFLKLAHKKAVSFELIAIWALYSRFFDNKYDAPKVFDRSFSFILDKKRLLNLAGMVLSLEGEEHATEWNICYELSKVI